MNILIVYLAVSRVLGTLYDTDGKYDHVTVGDFVHDSHAVSGWVVDLPGCVQEGNRMLREEREWLLEQGKQYAESQSTGTAVLVYNAQTDSLSTVFDTKQQYPKLGTAVDGTYALSLWHDCTAETIPVLIQAEQLKPPDREFYLNQGREYVQAQAAAPTTPP